MSAPHHLCMSCESTVSDDDANAVLLVQDKLTVAAVCPACVITVKSFKLSFTRDSQKSNFHPLQYQCIDTFEGDAYKERLTNAS